MPRSIAILTVIGLGLALLAGVLLYAGQPAPTVHAAPAVRLAGPAFVKPGGTDVDCRQDDPCGSIQYAINQSASDGIIYVAGGVYTSAGPSVITITKSLTLYGGWDGALAGPIVCDPASYTTTLDGEQARRVVYVGGKTVAFTLDGFYLTRGNASNAPAWPRYGGALYANMITLRLHDCAFVDNVAYAAMASAGAASGGAVYVLNPYPTAVISGCRFVNNTAAHAPNTPGRGGALNVEGGIVGTLALVGNDFAGNVASIDGAGWGGAVALQAGRRSYTLDSNILVGNTGNYTSGQPGMGGGIYLWSAGPTTMTHNLVSGNTANGSTGEGYGGGLLILISPDVYLADNAIQENRATVSGFGGGGGLRANNSTLILAANRVCSNTVSADPTAGAQGGGLWLEIGDFDLVNNVIAGNEAGQAGAGVWLRGTLADGAAQARLAYNTIADNGGDGVTVGDYAQAMLTNTILAGNVAALRVSGATSSILVADHTLFWGNPTLVTGSHALVGEPDFVNPVAWDYAIGPASAARDVGVPVPGVTTDIAGHPRPAGAAPDIGAYEYQPVYWLYLPLVARD